MSILDSLRALVPTSAPTVSPGWETALSALPQIFGAFEQARGRPIGAPLEVLGDLIGQNAAYRQKAAGLAPLQKLVSQTLSPQTTPQAFKEFTALQPTLGGLDPDAATKQLQRLQALGEKETLASERTQTVKSHFFKDGTPYLLDLNAPPGQRMTDLNGQPISPDEFTKHQVANETDQLRALNTVAKAQFGAPDFATLRAKDPQAAEQAFNIAAKMQAQPKADVELQKSLELQAQANANAMQREAISNANALSREETMLGLGEATKPSTPTEKWLLDNKNITPGQLRSMPAAQREKVVNDAETGIAADTARQRATSADALINVATKKAGEMFLQKPVMNSTVFTVDPTTLSRVGSPADTLQDATKKGYGFISKRNEPLYDSAITARQTLRSYQEAGLKVLPDKGTVRTTELELLLKGQFNSDVAGFKAARIQLIPVLRTIAQASKVNQQELLAAIGTLQNVGNKGQLRAAVSQANKAVEATLNSMMQQSKTELLNSKRLREGDAARAVLTSPGTYSAPTTPGISDELGGP